MLNPKQTRWKKSRKYGDVFGGRKYPKMADKVFNRAHSLGRPDPQDPLPIFLLENPSRSMYFPVTVPEINKALLTYPEEQVAGITHIWLRRAKPTDFEQGAIPFAEYICGSGVHLIVLYPWPRNMMLKFTKKPTAARLRQFERWKPELIQSKGLWCLKWRPDAVKDFYINDLIPHEVGHHIDYQKRHWSKANSKKREEFAIQFANQRFLQGSKTIS